MAETLPAAADTVSPVSYTHLPQVFSSIVTIVTVFFAMLFSNLVLTALVLLCVGVMLLVSRFISGRSGSFFIKQQEACLLYTSRCV